VPTSPPAHLEKQRSWRRLPIGAKLTLLYTAAITVMITAVSFLVYTEVTRRINREAMLLLQVETRELADEIRTRLPDGRWDAESLALLSERFDRFVRTSDPSLRVGVALVTSAGERPLRKGSLATLSAPVPTAVLAHEQESSLRAVNLGEPYAYLAMAVPVPGGAIQMVLSTERYADNVSQVRDVFLLAFPAAIVLTAVLAFVLAFTTLRPIRRIIDSARSVSGANVGALLPLSGSGDELDRLVGTLNDMLIRIQSSMSQMRRFNANAAHELRTPISALSSQLEVILERERTPAEYQHVLSDAYGRVQALAEVIDAMLRLARSEAGLDPTERVPVSVPEVLENVLEFFAPVAEEGGVILRRSTLPNVRVMGDAGWLQQLFANLVANAIKFTPKGGSIDVQAEMHGGDLHVRVRDSGPGMLPEDLEHCFERFHRGTSEPPRPGFGLGLPIAREIARAHGGEVEIEKSDTSGTVFRVRLPIHTGATS
jgi:two-component system, OmpR family, sensor kinase